MCEVKRIVGIIAEYNPFHHGHQYQLQEIRKRLRADIVIVMMSGNIVQRGEFAIVDKWSRAKTAIALGADLVIEMPTYATLQAADFFAKWNVELLNQIGCNTLVFGTETASTAQLISYIEWYLANEELIQAQVKQGMKQGYSYPVANQTAIDVLLEEQSFDVRLPNHVLGIQYALANARLERPMTIETIPRLRDAMSGSDVRRAHFNGVLQPMEVPERTYQQLNDKRTVGWEDYWELLRYQISTQSRQQLQGIVGVDEGLDKLLVQRLPLATSFASYAQLLTTKRWTTSRIQRALLAILLNIRRDEWQMVQAIPPALRILAYNEEGQAYLRQCEQGTVNLFSNLKQGYTAYSLNLKADRIYQLNPKKQIPEQIIGKFPILFQK